MKVVQTDVSCPESTQTPKFFKPACGLKHGLLRRIFGIILHAKYNYSGLNFMINSYKIVMANVAKQIYMYKHALFI